MSGPDLHLVPSPPVTPLDHALAYGRLGFRVFPQCWPDRNGQCAFHTDDCAAAGKRPLHSGWQGEASSFTDPIVRMWTKHPDGNIGLVLGKLSGVFELDVDVKKGDGLAQLEALEREHGPLPMTPTARSGSGGRKYLFAYPSGVTLPNKRLLADDIEVLGEQHATTLPPSVYATGTRYEWLPGLAPWETPVVEAPAWIFGMIPDTKLRARDMEHPEWAEKTIAQHFGTFVRDKQGWTVRCPAGERHNHNDDDPSLWLTVSKSGRLNPYCRTQSCHEALGKAGLLRRAGITKGLRTEPKPIPAGPRSAPDGRTIISLGPELHETVDAAISALAGNPRAGLFVHSARLARVVNRERGEPAIIGGAPETIQELLADSAVFTDTKDRQTAPPLALGRMVVAREEWDGIPELMGVSESPVLRPDGTVHRTPGYDPHTGVLLLPGFESPAIAYDPGIKSSFEVVGAAGMVQFEIVSAALDILAVFMKYKFANPKSDLPAVLAMALTPVARAAIGGPVPMFCITSPVRGSGKGKLATAASIIATGREPAAMPTPQSREEWAKVLLSVALEGDPVLLLDNVEGVLRSGELAAAVTSGRIQGRLLGLNKIVKPHWTATVIATGNNLALGGDLARRAIPITIDTGAENPDRLPFKFDPVDVARRERPRLHALALALLEAHARDGRPAHGGAALGSFEGWDRWVRSAVIRCGLGDPLAGREAILREADADLDQVRETLAVLRHEFGSEHFTVKAAVARAGQLGQEALRAVLAGTNYKGDGAQIDARKVGSYFRALKNRPLDGSKLIHVGTLDGSARWRVIDVADDPTRDPASEEKT